MSATVTKTAAAVHTATLKLPAHSEHCFTVQSGENSLRLLRAAAEEQGAHLLSRFVFAGNQHYAGQSATENGSGVPAVWLQGDACTDGDFYSVQGVAVSGLDLQPVTVNGRPAGFIYQDETARWCRLSGLTPADTAAPRDEQARAAFELAKSILEENGFAFTDTIRTWIYLEKLLEWYDEFNTVRTAFFNENGVFEKMVPASTGIGAGNPHGAAIQMDLLAVQPLDGCLAIQAVASPLQNPALDYKSSFSRAVELTCPTHRSLLISGTASIAPDGKTVHLDDPEKQIRLTMEVVHAILRSRGMDWSDLFRGIAYFKNMEWLPIYRRIAGELGIPDFPLAVSHADVCRADLLFEIEVDAVKPL
jgi:enamine deaminase RidA (YjgF/YER057c/UK114 family)